MTERAWHAVHCAPLKERLATRLLLAQGIEVFWPHFLCTVRLGQRRGYALRSWFPRYLFVADGPTFSQSLVNGTMGVSRLVYSGETLLTIPYDVILDLKSLADPRGLIPMAKNPPANMVAIRGDNLVECLRQLASFKTKVWQRGLEATVRAG
jgi:hypothetical protein